MDTPTGKKIAIVSYYFNRRDTDRIYSAYRYFVSRGYDVTVLCGDFDHNSKRHVDYGLPGVCPIAVAPYRRNISFGRLWSNVRFGFDARRKLRMGIYDIVYVVAPPNSTGYILRRTVRRMGAMLVLDLFDLNPESIPVGDKMKKLLWACGFWFWAFMRDRTLRDADLFLGSCRYYFSRLRLPENAKHHVVPLCKGDVPEVEIETLPVDEIGIVYVGALTGNYDFEGLVALMAGLKREGRRAKLYIVGDGFRREWLLGELERWGIDYEFLGRVYDDEVKQSVFRRCHFGFNGFKADTAIALSYKSMEYMSGGLALINSCKEDTWELVEKEGTGLNYSPGDTAGLVRRILSLDAEQVAGMKRRAVRAYAGHYSFSCYCRRMDGLFEHVKRR